MSRIIKLRRELLWAAATGCASWMAASSPCLADPINWAVEVTATAQDSPPQISLQWPAYPAATYYSVSRKLSADSSWDYPWIQTNSTGTLTGWTDTNVVPGTVYEYQVFRYDGSITAYGETMSAIRRPLMDSRGKLILVVDDTQSAALSNELGQLQQDLVGDGWQVIRHEVDRKDWSDAGWKDAVTNVKSLIVADYNADTQNVKAVFLFGHVPVPYSGDQYLYPDGHTEHAGAWPADVYYGDVNGNWTDTSVNWTGNSDPRQNNLPGDGKFDQDSIPSDLELQVGRVDLSNLPCFTTMSETDLLRQYLNKDHNYRTKLVTTQPQGLVDDNFGDYGGEEFAQDGWRTFGHMYGPANVFATGWLPTLATDSYQWAYGCGAGSFQSASGVATCNDFAATDVKVNFTMLFGSYFGDWDVQNNLLRSVLGSTTYTLSCSWGARPQHFYHFMTIGETLGECMRRTQNNYGIYLPSGIEVRMIHVALMGDPSLRLHIIAPAGGLNGVKSVSGQASLGWTASPEPGILGYNVYRAANSQGPYTRLTSSPVTGTNYTDASTPTGNVYYMVRPINLQVSTAGSYTNAGQGIFAIVGDYQPIPAAPSGLTAAVAGYTQINLVWTDNSTNEDSFLIERKTGAGGAYVQVATVGANVTNYSDNGVSPAATYYYRVRAHNSGGNSDYSNEANATTPTPAIPAAPSALTATPAASSQINLTWTDNSSNESGFLIERSTGVDGSYVQIATVGANVTTYNDTGLIALTLYYYRVRATNAGGSSGYSNEANATTPASGALVVNFNNAWYSSPYTVGAGTYTMSGLQIQGPNGLLTQAIGTATVNGALKMDSGGGTVSYALSGGSLSVSSGQPLWLDAAAGMTALIQVSGSAQFIFGGGDAYFGNWGGGGSATLDISGSATVTYSGGQFQMGVSNSYINVTGGGSTISLVNVRTDGHSIGGLIFTLDNSTNHISPIVSTAGNFDLGGSMGAIHMATTGFSQTVGQKFNLIQIPQAGTIFVPGAGASSLLNADNLANWSLAVVTVSGSNVLQATALTGGGPSSTTAHGIPYSWLTAHGITNTSDSVETQDLDGSGLNILQDYIAGLDPTNSNSCFSIIITNSAGQIVVNVPSVQTVGSDYTGKTRYYDIEQCSNMIGGSWQPAPGCTSIIASGGIIACTNATLNHGKFYRARVWLQ